jgi:Domain of unknown function (DUF1905)/Bacteriocin-protection, YdeI or OmpD-Associated
MTSGARFAARIYRVGANYCVDVPERVSGSFAGPVHVPVDGTVNGHEFRTTLVPRGGGRYRLFLNGHVRAAAGVALDDTVTIELSPDRSYWQSETPDDLRAALGAVEDAEAAFDRLPPATRRSMIAFLESAKRPETWARRVKQIVQEMASRL